MKLPTTAAQGNDSIANPSNPRRICPDADFAARPAHRFSRRRDPWTPDVRKAGKLLLEDTELRKSSVLCATGLMLLLIGLPQLTFADGPYKVSKVVKVGGEGTFDTAFADVEARRLYIPRKSPGRISVFNLDSLEPVGEIPDAAANGVVIDPKSGHGFASSKPVTMFDAKTLKTIKTIDVQGRPDTILFDPFNQHVFIFSHTAPNATVINAVDGEVLGTIDLDGEPEQAVTDRNGRVYVDVRDKNDIAVIDAKTLTVAARYSVATKGGRCSGLAIDVKNRILFAGCRMPQTMVILNAADGKILEALPIGSTADSAIFNPKTNEAYSAQIDGTLTIIKENSPTRFAIEQIVQTKDSAKQMVWDSNTNRILLIAADFLPPTEAPRAGVAGYGGKMVPDSLSILVVTK
jgi:DNA-binding beta-propeller fold protein YncE